MDGTQKVTAAQQQVAVAVIRMAREVESTGSKGPSLAQRLEELDARDDRQSD